MRSENFEAIFRRDLDRLPGLADDEWLPKTRRQRPRLTLRVVGALTALALLAMVVGLRVQAVPDDQDGAGPAASSPFYIATQSTAERPPGTSLVASNALTGAPSCPGSQIPWLVATFPARPGAEPPGSASPEAAFRKANPAVTEFTMYLWSVSQPVRGDDPRISIFMPIWIVAGNETFVVHAVSFGPMNEPHGWFAFPAEFMGCITGAQPSRSNVPRR